MKDNTISWRFSERINQVEIFIWEMFLTMQDVKLLNLNTYWSLSNDFFKIKAFTLAQKSMTYDYRHDQHLKYYLNILITNLIDKIGTH